MVRPEDTTAFTKMKFYPSSDRIPKTAILGCFAEYAADISIYRLFEVNSRRYESINDSTAVYPFY